MTLDCAVAIGPAADPCAGRVERAEGWAFSIDGVFVGDARAERDPSGASIISWDRPARLCLWAIDRLTQSPAEKIFARAGGVWFDAAKRFARPDAALDVGIPGAAECGFAIRLVPPINAEVIELFALSSDGTYASMGTVVVAAADPLASSVLPRSGGMLGHLQDIEDSGRTIAPQSVLTVQRGTVLTFRGWAVDALGPRLAGGVFCEIDGTSTLPATYRLPRPDVALTLGALGVAACGFTVTLDTSTLGPGRHRVSLAALTARSDAIGLIGDPITLTVYG